MNTKVCFKGDGTRETGAKIIKALERLGGVNQNLFDGTVVNNFYCIHPNGNITYHVNHPSDNYTLANPDDYLEKPYPKWMWVSDYREVSGTLRYVIGKFKHPVSGEERYVSIAIEKDRGWYSYSWKFAVDIPEEPTEQELIRKEIEELRAKLDELERRVK